MGSMLAQAEPKAAITNEIMTGGKSAGLRFIGTDC